MPQFDFTAFFVLIVTLIFIFASCYHLYLKMPLSSSSEALKMRDKLTAYTQKAKKKMKDNYIYNAIVRFFKK